MTRLVLLLARLTTFRICKRKSAEYTGTIDDDDEILSVFCCMGRWLPSGLQRRKDLLATLFPQAPSASVS
jgi:hypothetical protein